MRLYNVYITDRDIISYNEILAVCQKTKFIIVSLDNRVLVIL